MLHKIKPGDILHDNDKRMKGRTIKVKYITSFNVVGYSNTNRKTTVRINKIYTDGKERKAGFRLEAAE